MEWLRGISEEKFEKVLKECTDKVEGISTKDWQDIVDDYDLGIHRDVLRKAFQAPYGGYAVIKYLNSKNFSDSEKLSELEERELAIREERVRLNDVRRKINKLSRENARYKNNIELLENSINELEKRKPIQIYENQEFSDYKNEAVSILSDLHIGIKVDNYFNSYNLEVAENRLDLLARKIIEKSLLHKVGKIHVVINGDLISGAIHKSLVADAEISLIDSVIKGSEYISEFLSKLSSELDYVEVYFAIGNHSRINPDKKENLEKDNFEYLMLEYMKLRLKNVDNVHFNNNTYHDEIVNFNIGDKLILATHGDKDKPTTVAKNMTQFIGKKPYKIYLGHYHSYQSFDCNGTHVTVNGSVISTDSYAFSLRLNSNPYQVLTIYNSNTMEEECEYKLNLR